MLTRLTRRVLRQSAAAVKGRPILVLLEEGGRLIRLRAKGTRTWYTITVEQAYWAGVHNAAQEQRRLREEARRARKERQR